MKFEFSAGGIVYKKAHSASSGQDDVLVLVCQHSQHHGWVFPKGLIGDHVENEGKEQTAIREVKEETGVLGKIIKPLSPADYWYVFEGDPSTGSGKVRIKKTVYYYLMGVVSEDISKHDKEMENVEWLEAENVENRLTYPSEKKVWQEARKLL